MALFRVNKLLDVNKFRGRKMLLAMNEYHECCSAKYAEKEKTYYCRSCRKRVVLKRGKKKCAHFAHRKTDNCSVFSEGESEEHLQLKEYFMDWLGQSAEPAFLEAYLPRLRQRPDILLANLALEIQCSRLSHQRFVERTKSYLNNGYQVWWILGHSFLGQRQFSLIEKSCCYYNRKRGVHCWKADLKNQKLYLYHYITETVSGHISFFSSCWTFSGNDLKKIFTNNEIKINQMKKTERLSEDGKKWLARQLIYKQKNTVSIQEQCYLRHKHLLYLSPWIYQNSRFFFYLREQVFLYRMLYEESLKQQKVPDFSSWFCQVKEYKMQWLFPMIEEERVYRQFFDECTHLSSWKI